MTETTFEPNSPCTRAQIVTFLYRAAGSPELAKDAANPFSDVSDSSVYYNAILWAVEKKITTGVTETTSFPTTPAPVHRPSPSCTAQSNFAPGRS